MGTNDEAVVHDEQLVFKENVFSNYSLALIITIGIGCVLLTFNVLVFIIVYHRKGGERSISDKTSGSIRSVSSNNSLMLGLEGQSSKKFTENGGPALNMKNNPGKCLKTNSLSTVYFKLNFAGGFSNHFELSFHHARIVCVCVLLLSILF